MSIAISSVQLSDESRFLAAVLQSQGLHKRWVSPPSTREAFAQHIAKYSNNSNFSYVARNRENKLIGCVNVSAIVRGAFQSAFLGYYAFEPHNGRGLMKQAVSLVISEAFKQLQLHRLEANVQPENIASIALVKSLGFRHEGFSPRYLKIAGQWRDHERYALTVEDWT